MNYSPRWYQTAALDAIKNYFAGDGAGHPLIELPTASGKSLVQAMIAGWIITDYPDCRILFLTHQQELIKQNFHELIANLGTLVDAGIYSAGLNSRDTKNQIIFAGIQSVHRRAKELGDFNLIIVDECHLIPHKGEGMYRRFLEDQAHFTKIIGLTATPYRLDSGLLTTGKGAIFDDIIFRAPIRRLIDEGFLCPLVGKSGVVRADVNGVHKRGGEYIESELSLRCLDVVHEACQEMLSLTAERNHVLIFCASIAHANKVAEVVEAFGQPCGVVHSQVECQDTIRQFRDGQIKYIANVDMLTTGFNARHIDSIVMLRPTASPGLYYQMVGRGFRICEGKADCLVLDYAGNILMHGPVDKIEVQDKGIVDGQGIKTAPMKECPICKEPVFMAALKCPACGYAWPITEDEKHDGQAANVEPISKYKPPEEYAIVDVNYYYHVSKSGSPSMRVSYMIDEFTHFDEWVCIEHEGYAKQKAVRWLKDNLPPGHPIPDTIEDGLACREAYKKPSTIYVDCNSHFPKIISRVYDDQDY
jgi:DNA repair protein RadD